MKVKTPSKQLGNMMVNLTKRLFKEKFFEWVKNSKQTTFFMANGKTEYVAVVDYDQESIEIFYDSESFITAHSMFAGNEKNLTLLGYTSLSMCKIDSEKFDFLGLAEAQKAFKLYKVLDKTIAYTSRKKGQADVFVDDKEANMMCDVLEYLSAIQSFYKKGYETMPNDGKEYVLAYGFDDEEETYTSRLIELNNFKFLPDDYSFQKSNKWLVESLKDLQVYSGDTYIGMYFTKELNPDNLLDPLMPIIMYASFEDEVFEYVEFKTDQKEYMKTLRNALVMLLEKIGHGSDRFVTDNIWLYQTFRKSLKSLGIELKLDMHNAHNEFMWQSIDLPFQMSYGYDEAMNFIDSLKDSYQMLINNALSNAGLDISDEELNEIFDEITDTEYEDIVVDEEDEEDNDSITKLDSNNIM